MYHEVGRSSQEKVDLNSWCCILKLSISESTRISDQSSKTGAPRRHTMENAKILKSRSQFLEGSYPHPGRPGSCRSPTSRPCTRPSEQGPGIPTPPERMWWPHPWRSTVPEMKTHFTKGPWGEFLFSHKMRRGEKIKLKYVFWQIHIKISGEIMGL